MKVEALYLHSILESFVARCCIDRWISNYCSSLSTQSHFTTNPTGRTTTTAECACRSHKATERSTTRTNRRTWPHPPPTATPASRSDSKPTPTTWTSTPPHGGLQTGRTSSPAPPTPGCKNTQKKDTVYVELRRSGRLFPWVFVCGECTWVGALCGGVKGWGCMWMCVHLCWNCTEWPGLGLICGSFWRSQTVCTIMQINMN